jgi:cytochrome c556
MVRTILVGAALAIGVTAAVAQTNVIETRRNTMKGVGAATRIGNQMSKGEIPFDAAKAKEVLATYAKAADVMHTYFPDTSKTGGETTASPKIWESQAEFRKRFDDWGAEIKKVSASADDLASFRTAFGTVTQACNGCHETFRVKR